MPSNLENTTKGNLLEQVPVEKILRPKGFYKSLALDVLTVASAVYFSYSSSVFLRTGGVLQLLLAVFPLLVFSSLEVFLIRSLLRRFLVLLLETAAVLSFFYQQPVAYLAAAGGSFFVFSLWGEVASRSNALNSLEIRFLASVLPILRKTTTALTLVIIIFYLPGADNKNVFVSKQAFGSVFVWSTGFARGFYPEINFNSTVNDLAKELAKYQLTGTHPYEDLPPAAQKSVLDKVVAEVNANLKKFFGGGLTGAEKLSDILYEIISDTLVNWRMQFGGWFIASWVAVLFLLGRSFGALILWLSAFFSLLLYEFLVALNFLAIRGESTTKETLVFP